VNFRTRALALTIPASSRAPLGPHKATPRWRADLSRPRTLAEPPHIAGLGDRNRRRLGNVVIIESLRQGGREIGRLYRLEDLDEAFAFRMRF
jgi:hypothetical protein